MGKSLGESITDGLSTRGEIPLLDVLFASVAALPGAFGRATGAAMEGLNSGLTMLGDTVKNSVGSIDFQRGSAPIEVAEKVGRSADFHMGRIPEEQLGKNGFSMAAEPNNGLNGLGSQVRAAVQGLDM